MKETVYVTAEQIENNIYANKDFIMWHSLHSMPYAQCKVGIVKIDKNGEDIYIVFLKSYETIVCGYVLDNDYVYMFCTGIYSRTTGKQMSRFAQEFAGIYDYYTFKKISKMKTQCAIVNTDVMKYVMQQCDRYTGGELFGIHKSS